MNCIVFVGKRNPQSLSELSKISEVKNVDIYWAYDETEKQKGITQAQIDNLLNNSNSKIIQYKYRGENLVLKTNKNFQNYPNILFDDVFAQYDYIYFTHYDNHYTGKWQELIDTLDQSNANYLAPKIKVYAKEQHKSWMWIDNYLNNRKYVVDANFKSFVSSYARFFRISKDALQFLKTYNVCDIKNSFYELWITTLLWNYNYTLEAIDSNMSDEQFKQNINVCNAETFNYGVHINKKRIRALVNKYQRDLLCGGWEENEHDIMIDSYWIGTKPDYPKYSIVIPVYNDTATLPTVLDSIHKCHVDKSLYEIIIVDDGSTDDLYSVIKDIDCHYISKKHNGLADTLNAGFNVARGEFIFVQMPYAIMDADRLTMQSELTVKNVWEFSFGSLYSYNAKSLYKTGKITKKELFDRDIMYEPGGLMVVNNYNKGSFEGYFKDTFRKYACYRIINQQITSAGGFISNIVGAGCNISSKYDCFKPEDTEMVIRCYNYKDEDTQLTCIINFRNEGVEVERTVQSIRATASNVSIILINDGSDPKYERLNYEHIAHLFHCTYIKHEKAKGCGPSRDEGVENCKTPYFLLLDSHMRFYEFGWDDRLLALIPKYPGCIISANTSIIWKDDDGYYTNEDGTGEKANTYCCTLDMDESRLFDVKWTSRYVSRTPDKELYEVYCVLGAGYCSSVEHWNNMEGLKGLGIYGLDEGLMSYKTWAMGGHNYILKDLRIGHIYRPASPFPNTSDVLEGARISLYHMFLEGETFKYYINKLRDRLSTSCFSKAMQIYESNKLLVEHTKRNLRGKLKYSIIDFVNANKAFLNIK